MSVFTTEEIQLCIRVNPDTPSSDMLKQLLNEAIELRKNYAQSLKVCNESAEKILNERDSLAKMLKETQSGEYDASISRCAASNYADSLRSDIVFAKARAETLERERDEARERVNVWRKRAHRCSCGMVRVYADVMESWEQPTQDEKQEGRK